jgi:spore coat protein CotH
MQELSKRLLLSLCAFLSLGYTQRLAAQPGMGRGGFGSRIKSKDDPDSWAALIRLCKVLNQIPEDKLEETISPILDIEETLKFLALDRVLVNGDGYWSRASDYVIYLDANRRFHILPFDQEPNLF